MGSLYETTIQDIIRQGGDADTNACVAGNLMGSFLGFCRLPKEVRKNRKEYTTTLNILF